MTGHRLHKTVSTVYCNSGKAVGRSSMAVWWCALLASCLLGLPPGPEAKARHAVPTYFKRINPDGTVVNADDSRTRIKFAHPIRERFTPNATLTVSPSLVENGAAVNVSWSGITQPSNKDFIAFYCPENDQPDHYLDYFYVTDSANASGYGWREVNVYNMRSKCEFRYYQQSYVHVATSNLLQFKGGIYVPLQGHIALTGDPSQMRVMWVSGTGKIVYTVDQTGVECFR